MISGILAAACAFLSFSEVKQVATPPPNFITREVVREVPKEVPAEIPESYKEAKRIADSLANAEVALGDETLAGVRSLKVRVSIPDVLKDKVSETELKDAIELGLRKNGIPIKNDGASAALWFMVEGLWDDQKVRFSFSARLTVDTNAFFFVEGKAKMFSAEIWKRGYTGYAGSNKIEEQLREAAEKLVIQFSNRYLAENPR
jgi:hypothetical protein